jgi:hypothetical protein
MATCAPTNGGVERCDGVDNDCNDAIDDGISCVTNCTTTTYGGRSYAACSDMRDWVSAAFLCTSLGMRLVRIDDAAEETFAENAASPLVNGNGAAWLGASDLLVSEDWAWVDGTVFFRGLQNNGGAPVDGRYNNFGGLDPNHAGPGERCVAFRPRQRGFWYDYTCSDNYPYLCEAY